MARTRGALSRPLLDRVVAELLAHPSERHGEIAARLADDEGARALHPAINKAVIDNLLKKFGVAAEVSARRDRALAERLKVALDRQDPSLSIGTMVDRVADEIPHVGWAEFVGVRDRNRPLLDAYRREARRFVMPRTQADRVRAVILAHPTFDVPTTVARLRVTPGLEELPWSVELYTSLSSQRSRPLPSQAERDRALAGHADAIWGRSRAGSGAGTIDEVVAAIAAEHPGFDVPMLARVASHSPRLIARMDRALGAASVAARPAPALAPAALAALDLPRAVLRRGLARDGSPLVAREYAAIARRARASGYSSDAVQPRILEGAPEPVVELMAAIYGPAGARLMSLDEVEVALPGALAALATSDGPRAAELRREATAEAVVGLALDWRAEIGGGGSGAEFGVRHGLSGPLMARVRPAAPGEFQAALALPLDETHRVVAATLYREVLAGRMSARAFYRRAGITRDELIALQEVDPRFPRLEPGRRRAPLPSGAGAAIAREAPPRPVDRRSHRALSDAEIDAIAAVAHAVVAAEPLADRDDISAEFNRDPGRVATFGELTPARYSLAGQTRRGVLPELRKRETWTAALGDEVLALRAAGEVRTRRDAFRALRARHPRFNEARMRVLVDARPELTAGMERAGYGDGRRVRRVEGSRSNALVGRLTHLAMTLAPPGTPPDAIARVVDQLLIERGIAPPRRHAKEALRGGRDDVPTLTEHRLAQLGEILAEYVRAAPSDMPAAKIYAWALAEHPGLPAEWRGVERQLTDPRGTPALDRFRRDGVLTLVGENERVRDPRYLGGWDPARLVRGGGARDRGRLARLSRLVRVPYRLPLLDQMVEDLGGARPLADKNLLWVGHLQASTYPLARALRAAGAAAESTIVVGTPYGSPPMVRELFVAEGVAAEDDVRVPALDPRAFEAEVARAVADMVARHRANGQPVVVMDDGGLVTKILHTTPEYDDVIGAFRIVEQTTRGITEAEARPLRTVLIDVASSLIKTIEARFIGRAVVAKIAQALGRIDLDLDDKTVVVVGGGGKVGGHTARELHRRGARVLIVESAKDRAGRAGRWGKLVTLEEALPQADVVIGSTGETSLHLDDLRLLHDGAVVLSASSKRLEIDMDALAAAAEREPLEHDEPLVTLPSARYRLDGNAITVLGDGWPINFDGDAEDIPTHDIQITRAGMFAGLLQAAGADALPRHRKNQRKIPLDGLVDRLIGRRFRALPRPRGGSPIGDPASWASEAEDIARRFTVPTAR